MKAHAKLDTRGWGPWRAHWYSLCSAHRARVPNCTLCSHGLWRNYWRWCISHAVFKISPRFWCWWVNR